VWNALTLSQSTAQRGNDSERELDECVKSLGAQCLLRVRKLGNGLPVSSVYRAWWQTPVEAPRAITEEGTDGSRARFLPNRDAPKHKTGDGRELFVIRWSGLQKMCLTAKCGRKGEGVIKKP
jgi:hypothetical protein